MTCTIVTFLHSNNSHFSFIKNYCSILTLCTFFSLVLGLYIHTYTARTHIHTHVYYNYLSVIIVRIFASLTGNGVNITLCVYMSIHVYINRNVDLVDLRRSSSSSLYHQPPASSISHFRVEKLESEGKDAVDQEKANWRLRTLSKRFLSFGPPTSINKFAYLHAKLQHRWCHSTLLFVFFFLFYCQLIYIYFFLSFSLLCLYSEKLWINSIVANLDTTQILCYNGCGMNKITFSKGTKNKHMYICTYN